MRSIVVIVFLSWQISVSAQQQLIRLSSPVNHPGINVSAPFISLDGKSLLFISDDTEDNVLSMFYSARPDGINWKEPVLLPKTMNSRINFLGGFALSADGRQLYFTTLKGGGVGGYDIFESTQRGTSWTDPVNVGMPINSKEHDACPSINSEGTTIFFMRCSKMDARKAEGCRIMMATRRSPSSPWTQAVELPATVNSGNSQTPRIMGDGETLIFSSDKISGKGGMDLFVTRKNGDSWTSPVPLGFANTEADDQFVSATALGRYLMKSVMGKTSTEIIEMLFPADVKPKGIMKVVGNIQGPENLASPYVSLFDRNTGTKLFNTRPEKDGVFTLYLKEGINYQIVVDPEKDNFRFFTKEFDLTGDKISTMERVEVNLRPVTPGDVIELPSVEFRKFSSELVQTSLSELQKAVRMINGNPGMKFSVEVDMYGYKQDSVASDPDLTEVHIDSTHYAVTTMRVDSTGTTSSVTSDSVAIKKTFHNDRTASQAVEIVNYLIEQGVPAANLLPSNKVFAVVPEERKTLVRVIALGR